MHKNNFKKGKKRRNRKKIPNIIRDVLRKLIKTS